MVERKLRSIGSMYCTQYKTNAELFIEDHPSGRRLLFVRYENGGYERKKEFAAGIPDEWTEQEVQDFIMRPMKDRDSSYPAWEVPARAYGRPELFRWWEGEKPSGTR
jgi:hypothetical protein